MAPPPPSRPITSERSQAPYRLHALLGKHGIQHGDLRRRLRYRTGDNAGNVIAASTMSSLLLRREWPRALNKEGVRTAVREFLTERGVPPEEIATAWDVDGELVDGEPIEHSARARVANPPPPKLDPFVLPETEMLSAAARDHFNIAANPFVNDVLGPQDVYLSRDQRYIRESMYQAAKNGGFLAVVGESGSGKSTLRRDLLERITRDNEPVVLIQPKTLDKEKLTAEAICDAIVVTLSTEVPKLRLEAKARQVERILSSSARTGVSHALLVEEAHDLTIKVLKYLKRFWEMEDGFRRLLGIVLVGQPELADKLDERRNYEAREVIRRCEIARLKPLNGNLEDYLALKFKRVGLQLEDVLERDAYDAIRTRLTRRRPGTADVESHLYPLVVQNLLVKCMNQAAELGLPKVNADLVGRV